jgi:hypothetical protein
MNKRARPIGWHASLSSTIMALLVALLVALAVVLAWTYLAVQR